jgi:hypothetical protein
MAYEESWLATIPPPPPLGSIADPGVRQRIERGLDALDGRGLGSLGPGFVWSVVVSAEAAQLAAVGAAYPFVDRIAFGFTDPELGEGDPRPAVLVYADPPDDVAEREDLVAAYHEEDELVVGRDAGIPGSERFPVLARVTSRRLQVGLFSPSSAMTTAWATVRRSTRPRSGWLLPYHAVGGKNAVVTYDDGSSGRVIESLGACIDAAVTSTSVGMPAGYRPLAAFDAVAPGLPLAVTDQQGQRHNPAVVDVAVDLGLVTFSRSPIRMTYDWATSAAGDSGALVTLSRTGEPVAMHQGVSRMRDRKGTLLVDPASGRAVERAFGLCLYQVQVLVDAELSV